MSSSIAFLGTGLMGAPMARHLLDDGHAVTVWNRTRAKAEALTEHGARLADTPGAAVQQAELVITMLEHDNAVATVLFDMGVADAIPEGGCVIDMSSIAPHNARDHAKRLGDRAISHLDAPVSGGPKGAAEANLAIMVGGDPGTFTRCEPFLELLGRPTLVGGHGAGQLAKLCNQIIVAVTIGAVSEALLLAASGGADPAAVRSALAGGFADGPILQSHGGRMLDRNFVPGGPIRMQIKDLDNILTTATNAGIKLPLASAVTDLFRTLGESGGSEYDHSALLLQLEKINGSARVGTAPDQLPDPD